MPFYPLVNGLWSAHTSKEIQNMLSDFAYFDRDSGHANPEGAPPPVSVVRLPSP